MTSPVSWPLGKYHVESHARENVAIGFVAVQDRHAAVQAGSLPKLFADDSSCVRSRAAEVTGTRELKRENVPNLACF